MRSRRRARRRGGAGLAAIFLIIGAGTVFTITVALDALTGGGTQPRPMCSVDDGAHQVRLTPEQMANAALITGVGMDLEVGERAMTIALATAMQESSLRNLDHGDRDSLGLFQQRPSQGWGSTDEVQDRVYATRIFYDRLLAVPGYEEMPLTEAAQTVQISAFPSAYAKHEPMAEALRRTFTGEEHATVGCELPASEGLAHDRLLEELSQAHPGARARGVGEAIHLAGPHWPLAQWAVATAARTGVSSVQVGDQEWTRARGWQTAEAPIEGVRVR